MDQQLLDRPEVVRTLQAEVHRRAAGAAITAAGNGAGRSLLAMALGNPAMQEALGRHGAR
ncbi:MAG: hypothetical protein ABI603_12290 [Acidobacteriota bacterium]